jgi:nucleotide-binding universal stress UspA family protein
MGTRAVREILVATDFSETAESAVRLAHAHAAASGARLHVLHVSGSEEAELKERLARLVAELGTGVPVVIAWEGGDAAGEIVRYARAHEIDLLVIGTHGRTGVGRVLAGSVAAAVIRTAPCLVLTVPPPAELQLPQYKVRGAALEVADGP